MDVDVKDAAHSSGADDDEQKNNLDEKGQEKAGADSDKSAGDKSKDSRQIPYSRFKEVVDKHAQAEQIINWYRENIGDPDKVIEFQKWKNEQLEHAKEEEAKGKISPEKLANIRKLMREADPEYKDFLEERKREKQEKMEAQVDDAEEEIRDLCGKAGFPKDEKVISRVAVHIMDEIKNDPKLLRMWQTGNMGCISKAFKAYQEDFLTPMGKTSGKVNGDKITDKRRISRLPAFPSGGSPETSRTEKRDPNDKGINKGVHEKAWDVLQSYLE